MDTNLGVTVTPTASMGGSIDLPPLSKEPPRRRVTLIGLLSAGVWSLVALAVILALRAAWKWST